MQCLFLLSQVVCFQRVKPFTPAALTATHIFVRVASCQIPCTDHACRFAGMRSSRAGGRMNLVQTSCAKLLAVLTFDISLAPKQRR
uniref:Uncharacterized protein n=1 Tax=Ixodes ricinus TaxID=34613 RepID=A0A0K8RJT9_IXORI